MAKGKGEAEAGEGGADGEASPGHVLSLDALREAWRRVRGAVHRTPVVSSDLLGRRVGAPLLLKAENLQKTGSFKVRGALNRLRTLDPEARDRGVVTVSAGNHAQALAWAARTTGTACTVVMPEAAPRSKVRASRAYGARVVLHGSVFDAFQRALDLASERGLTFVHPFDDPAVVAGQAGVGLEILEDVEALDAVIVPVGGGGLIAGIATAVHRLRPGIRVIGVEPAGAPVMRRSLDAGAPARLESAETIADGLASPVAGELTFACVRSLVEDVVLVDDDEIRMAMTLLLSRTKLLAEPAGAAAVAALLAEKVRVKGPVVAVVSGGNVDPERLGELLLPEA